MGKDEWTEQDTKDAEGVSEDTALVAASEKGLAVPTGLGIEGLEDVPASILPIPFVRIVQPTSQKVELLNGQDAPAGSFFFNDTKEAVNQLSFAIIKAKHQIKEFERDGVLTPTKQLAILGETIDGRMFILTLSVMSFNAFGSLVAQMKKAGIARTWEYQVDAVTMKNENEKGKFYTAEFRLGEKLPAEKLAELEAKYQLYGGVLDSRTPEE